MIRQGFARRAFGRGTVALALAVLVILAVSTSATPRSRRPFSYCADQHTVFNYPRPFLGINDPSFELHGEPYRSCSLGRMSAAGIGYFRAPFNWQQVELHPNQYWFQRYDLLVGEIARYHMHVLGLLEFAPSWRSTAPSSGAAVGFYPPRVPGQFAYFASLMVMRYGPGGTFWRENPGIPYYPVRAWQVWNEPNLAFTWEPQPDIPAYVQLLRATYVAIKRIDPRATVVSAGMPFYGNSDETSFISEMYRSGARGYFDALAIHAYSPTVAQAMQRLWTARRLLNRFGDGNKPLWVTELGWAGGDPDGFIVNPTGQRRNLASFLGLVQRARRRLRLREFMWYGWQDRVYGPGPANWWGYHLGMFTTNLQPKPALAALSAAARRLDRW
jgi:hypothetical protein